MNRQARQVELARILRQRREQMSPDDLGIPHGIGARRVAGLRRDEVAALAGISVDWYTRLEQARSSAKPSVEVVERLAHVLRMTDAERAHIVALLLDRVEAKNHALDAGSQVVIQNVLDALNPAPAIVLDRYWNTIAWNRAACVGLVDYETLPKHARNLAWAMFLDPYVRQIVVDWESNARRIVAQFHADYGQNLGDPLFEALLHELKTKSAEFRAWWEANEIGGDFMVSKLMRHPDLGELCFEQSSYLVDNTANWRMFLYLPHDNATKCKLKRALERSSAATLDDVAVVSRHG